MEFRILTREEIRKFHDLDRREIVKQIYYYRNNELDLVDEYYDIPDWTKEKKLEFIDSIEALYDRGGVVFGAFDGEKLVGMSTIDIRFMGKDSDLLNLNGLWVSRNYRGQGVAIELIDLVKLQAIEWGAKGLYVSATESKNTVEFYMNRGFVLAEYLDEELFRKEPKDIHMVMRFN